ncbi:MAG: hypothetical protein GF307_07530 [candidate division Zixibacteria bacterium]|nr:hypothetical protein [candidate division Zixibacteria bacterium]
MFRILQKEKILLEDGESEGKELSIKKKQAVILSQDLTNAGVESAEFPALALEKDLTEDLAPGTDDISTEDSFGGNEYVEEDIPQEPPEPEKIYTEQDLQEQLQSLRGELESEFETTLSSEKEKAFESGKETGVQEGIAKGKEEGLAEGLSKAEHKRNELDRLMKAITEGWKETHNSLEENLVKLSCALVNRIVMDNDFIPPNTLLKAIKGSSDSLVGEKKLIIKVNPEELEKAKEAAPDLLPRYSGKGVLTLEGDDSIKPGGCIMETDLGKIDATIERRWQELIKNITHGGNEVSI